MIKEAIGKIEKNVDLSEKETEGIFTEIMSGKSDVDDIASFLLALKKKGETVDEITGAARTMRRFATKINTRKKDLLDTCGTGGDEACTFNISTVSALVASGAGCSVAKHGNKAVSSRCGSADLLEALGVNINAGKEVVEKCINEIGIGFLFAPMFHLAMKYAMPARKKIKTRSIFNILGPLTNPAEAKFQLIGVYDGKLVASVANVLKNLGSERALVVHGRDGLDEITTKDATVIAELKDKRVTTYTVTPEEFGVKRAKDSDLKGGDASYNSGIALDILGGEKGPGRDIVCLNAGAAIYVTGVAKTLGEGVKKASESIDSGRASDKLRALKEITGKA